MKKIISLFAFLCLAIISGCHSDVASRHFAVERAREYLLKTATELTIEQISFVKYNEPALLVSDVLG
jgi:hypothetical protein